MLLLLFLWWCLSVIKYQVLGTLPIEQRSIMVVIYLAGVSDVTPRSVFLIRVSWGKKNDGTVSLLVSTVALTSHWLTSSLLRHFISTLLNIRPPFRVTQLSPHQSPSISDAAAMLITPQAIFCHLFLSLLHQTTTTSLPLNPLKSNCSLETQISSNSTWEMLLLSLLES